MKTTAIIAEYNPFHNGHRYQIEETRRQTGADYILILMSGDFVQRGAPALCNKYTRTRMALLGGADAVIELPALYALSSAEFFASGAVTLLNQLNTINLLSFGSESGNLPLLQSCAHMLTEENSSLDCKIREYLQQGYSYPVSRAKALSHENIELLSSPNNILGLEYCKALLASNSSIIPFTLKRKDAGYHETSFSNSATGYASASAIRNALLKETEAAKKLSAYVPSEVYQMFESDQLSVNALSENDFSDLLHYKLLSEQNDGFSFYLDCTSDLSDKICKYIPNFTNFIDFCNLLKSKDLTYTRISRVLMHILLNIKTPDYYRSSFKERNLYLPYARLLGFRKDSSPLLAAIKKHSNIPLISKPANAVSLLDEKALALFKQDIYCASVYESVQFHKKNKSPLNDWKQSPIILS